MVRGAEKATGGDLGWTLGRIIGIEEAHHLREFWPEISHGDSHLHIQTV